MTSLKSEFKNLMDRCTALHGTTLVQNDKGETVRVPTDKAVREFLTTLCADSTNDKEVADKIIAAYQDPTGEAQRALNSARIFQVGNFIAAESLYRSMFFETVTLGPSEEPWVENNTKNEIRVGDASQDGTSRQARVLISDDKFALGLKMIASDYIKYKTMDLYRGDISAPSLATFNIARDLAFQLDRKHYNLLTSTVPNGGAFGAFSVAGPNDGGLSNANKAKRIYVNHSGIITTHLPSTNDFDNAAVKVWDTEEGLTGFRPAVAKLIVNYALRWGKYLPDSAGPLVPTGEIIVPSSDIENMGIYLAVENSKPQTDLQTQVEQNGYAEFRLWGRNWRAIPDVTIPSGICYPRYNQVVGLSFDKPNMAGEDVVTNKLEHWEKRAQSRAWGAAVISQWRVRAIRVNYNA